MSSSYIDREVTIIAMTKALEPLFADLLPYRAARDACYARAGIDLAVASRLDSEAARRAAIHRDIMEIGKRREVA